MATAVTSRDRVQPAKPDAIGTLVLRIWEAANSEGELENILAAVAEVLTSCVPFAAATMVSFEANGPRFHGLYLVRPAMPHSLFVDCQSPEAEPDSELVHYRDAIPFDFNGFERRLCTGKSFTCPDILAKQAWQAHEFQLARSGARAYALQPLVLRGTLIGATIFSRSAPEAFTPEQLVILRATAPAVAVAMANAFEKQRSAARIDQLEAEIRALRSTTSPTGHKKEYPIVSPGYVQDQMFYLRDRMLDPEPGPPESVDQMPRLNARLKDQERRLIETALVATHGRISGPRGAALRLGLPASTLEFRIERLGIDKFRFHRKPQKQEPA
jgi:GAF domain